MITRLYSIYDSKPEVFCAPFVQPTDAVAVRMVVSAASDEKSQLCLYPNDMELFYLGEFNDVTGRVDSLEAPLSLGVVKDIVARGAARKIPVQLRKPARLRKAVK